MKIAFTTKGVTWESIIDERFGRTEYILIYDEETKELSNYDNRDIANEAHGAGPKTAQKLFDFAPDILITGNGPGGNAASILDTTSLNVFIGTGGMTVKEAYEQFKLGKLTKF